MTGAPSPARPAVAKPNPNQTSNPVDKILPGFMGHDKRLRDIEGKLQARAAAGKMSPQRERLLENIQENRKDLHRQLDARAGGAYETHVEPHLRQGREVALRPGGLSAEDEKELDLALKAAELNKSKDGTIEARLAAYESAKTAADDAASAAESTASSIASSASSWASTFQTGSSLADLISNMQSGASQLAQFNDMVGQLKSNGLSSSMSSWLLSQGTSGISLAQQILAGGSDAIAMLNEASGNLNSASTAIATTQETGTYTKSPVLSTVHLPSYVTSGAAGPTTPGSIYAPRSATFNVTSSDPYGAAVIIDQQLRYL